MSPSRVLTPAYKMENVYFISTCRRCGEFAGKTGFLFHSIQTLNRERSDNALRKLNELENTAGVSHFSFLIHNPPYFPAFGIEDGGEGGGSKNLAINFTGNFAFD